MSAKGRKRPFVHEVDVSFRPIADIATLTQRRAMLIRPIPFLIASGIAVSNLLCFAFLPSRTDIFTAACSVSFVVAGAILIWMLVLVRGDHGFVGRIVGVQKDRSLGLPIFARLLLGAGACVALVGFDLQAGEPAAVSLFTGGLALMAAGSTQLSRAGTI
jgi:hypothetical protein